MPDPDSPEREPPPRWRALLFQAKVRGLQLRRGLHELPRRQPRHPAAGLLADGPVLVEKRALLWRDVTPIEFPLTAGKVENLRRSARAFHGLVVPAGEIFSFWRQLGRTTRLKGYTTGRELREGCLVPAVGGGLCQLSGLLYQAALGAGLEVVERHAHSRILPGSAAEQDLDATVFWNYVDLRLRGGSAWRLEVELTASELVVRIRSASAAIPAAPQLLSPGPRRTAPSGDCLSCGMTQCFRHPAATDAHAPAMGHSTYLLDAWWPEFDLWCRSHAQGGDRWFLPLDGQRWGKPAYQWTPPAGARVRHATSTTLLRAFRQRRLPNQGAFRQRALLRGDAELARRYAAMLDPQCRHFVVSQNLLPHLWASGAMGGRTFDVLVERWPLDELQRRLDLAAAAHPQSTTLGDFCADPDLLRAEGEALAAAARLVTPHRAIADHFGGRSWLIDWEMPEPLATAPSDRPVVFFPASRLGRKGAFELAAAMTEDLGAELIYLGRADEGAADPFGDIACAQGTRADLARASVLVMPAWIEHQPRVALLALASGIPVVAAHGCGLPPHPLLHTLPSHDPTALRAALRGVLQPAPRPCAIA